MDILYVPMGYIIRFCYNITQNYAIALLLFTLLIKLILLPLGIKQQKGMIKQASLRPKEAAIRNKYAGRNDKPTQQKMQTEIMELYQAEGYNPMGGCLPLLIQFPVLIALYNVIRNPLRYICGLSSDTITKLGEFIVNKYSTNKELFNFLSDSSSIKTILEKGNASSLSGIDLMNIINNFENGHNNELFKEFLSTGNGTWPNFNLFGNFLDLSKTPYIGKTWLIIIPVLAFLTTFLSMKLTRKFSYQPQQDENAGLSMKIMDLTMPLFTLWMAFKLPAVLGLYWVYSNIFGFCQQFLLSKIMPYPKFTDEELKQAEKELKNKNKKSSNNFVGNTQPRVKSLHHIDDEDYQKKLEEYNKNNQEKTNKGGNSTIGKAPLKEDK